MSMEMALALLAVTEDRPADDGLVDLIELTRGGDGEALAELYDRVARELYGLALWRTGSKALAEDAVQELFVKLASGRVGRAPRIRSARAWLFTAVRRCAIDIERRSRRERPFEASVSELAQVEAPDTDGERIADRRRALRALADLPPKLREAVYLRHWADLTFSEIGDVTGVPTFTAASRFRLGISRLRRDLGVRVDP
jgi:RNA polymerase sigma-70 factor (ECF subfamily)